MSFLQRLRQTFTRARDGFAAIRTLGREGRPLDSAFWEDFGDLLIAADFGVPTAEKIVAGLKTVAAQELWSTGDQAIARFRKDVGRFLTLDNGTPVPSGAKPEVFLIVGVNGSGKTTTIGKLAHRLRNERKRVLLVAADTFRAAAAEQLEIWATRTGSEIVRGADGADPAAVVFDGIRAGKARDAGVILIDTAGRLQTKTNLMEELKKIRRVIERETGAPPAQTLLVLDGTTGQNALSQARLFHAATPLTGVIVTKLDSTAKGGILVAIVEELEIPILFVGLGEGADDLAPFDAATFVDALFADGQALAG
ncbi:MAG TPA: signal recognition particle-docking protein FtsY [Candidatus Tyrphobacter sp.]